MNSTTKTIFFSAAVALLGLLLTGCPKAKGPAPETPATAEVVPEPSPSMENPSQPGLEIGTDWTAVPTLLETATFEYMKADLTAEARASLKKNAGVLKTIFAASQEVKVRVEGHCDDRGTLEYNMALGQRRAKVVRDYYGSLGVAKSVLDTVSFGEERPLCAESTEDCWARNRRAETTLKASQPVRLPLPK